MFISSLFRDVVSCTALRAGLDNTGQLERLLTSQTSVQFFLQIVISLSKVLTGLLLTQVTFSNQNYNGK